MHKMIAGRLFLVGCPRSGTTLLQSMLATHSQILSFPESHFLLVTSRSWLSRVLYKMGIVSPAQRTRLHQFLTEIGEPALYHHFPRYDRRISLYLTRFGATLDQLTLNQQKRVWLEKTPGHLYYIAQWERVIQDAKFIHLLRNGADTIASLYAVANCYPNAWGNHADLDQCIRTWQHCYALSQHYQAQPNHLLVHYEALVTEPEQSLQTICQFIGLPFEPRMIHERLQTAQHLITASEPWKQATALHNANGQKFYSVFTPAEQAYVLAQLQAYS
ncbi:MAG: sulfotransferase [Caldilineaceae bacterium]|nr:sulfotransferase [Caldilineaceae bacterium]